LVGLLIFDKKLSIVVGWKQVLDGHLLRCVKRRNLDEFLKLDKKCRSKLVWMKTSQSSFVQNYLENYQIVKCDIITKLSFHFLKYGIDDLGKVSHTKKLNFSI
jgi:hypothetical protein